MFLSCERSVLEGVDRVDGGGKTNVIEVRGEEEDGDDEDEDEVGGEDQAEEVYEQACWGVVSMPSHCVKGESPVGRACVRTYSKAQEDEKRDWVCAQSPA